MKWLAAILVVTTLEWIIDPVVSPWSWQVALGAKYLTMALLIQALWGVSKNESLLFKSVVAFLCVSFWINLLGYIAWTVSKTHVNLSLPIFLIFSASMIYVLRKRYDLKSDEVNPENVTILFLKPRTLFEFVKSFFGSPVSSVCVVAAGYVWSFRKCSSSFGKYAYSDVLLKTHIAVDTKVRCNEKIIKELENVVGTNRIPSCKCVFSIRNVLNLLGGKFAVRPLDFIPGFYAARILK